MVCVFVFTMKVTPQFLFLPFICIPYYHMNNQLEVLHKTVVWILLYSTESKQNA